MTANLSEQLQIREEFSGESDEETVDEENNSEEKEEQKPGKYNGPRHRFSFGVKEGVYMF